MSVNAADRRLESSPADIFRAKARDLFAGLIASVIC
jgi:hypothetical protein